ncbi:MAG TPA: methyltransferase domain-containing protein [Anaerolineae bacterium]|nr:methyltransferase domain-containing protein [Anaerolineae bacterium]
MSNKSIGLPDNLHEYLLSISLREADIFRELREETAVLPNHNMQIAAEQGQFMAFLVRLMGARRALEVGVFTGYSSLAVALALPEDGQIMACDVSEEFTAVARKYWQKAGVAHKIQLHLAPAAQTLARFLDEGQAGQYDFAFIDADKPNYDTYYEQCLQLLRPGGLMAIDNVLWDGKVTDTAVTDPDTQTIRTLNQKLRSDERVDLSLVLIGDGLTLLRKR